MIKKNIMRVTIKTGIIFAILWMLIKLSFFGMGIALSSLKIAILINILLLLVAIAVGLFLQKKKDTEESNALRDMKNGLTTGLVYTVLVSGFIYIYYAKIDTDFIKHQIAEQKVELIKVINDPAKLKSLKKSNETWETMSKEEIYSTTLKNLKSVYSPTSTSTIALLAMLLLSTLNSIFVTVVYRKIVFSEKALK